MFGVVLNRMPIWRLLSFACLLHASIFSVAQVGDQQLTKIANWNAYVHMPDDYDASPTKKYPVIIFIPGLGEVGTDASKLLVYGPGYYIKQGQKMQFTVNGIVEKPLVISLQPSGAWPNPDVMNTRVDSILKRWRIDPSRVYMTGLSMGGFAADNYITGNANYAKKIAAIVAMSAVEPNFPLTNLRPYALNGGKWWGFEGTTDYRKMDLIRDTMNRIVPGSARYTQYVGGHCCWNTWYNPSWVENGDNIYTWMLKQSLSTNTPIVNIPPIANAGADQTIAEGTIININSSASADPDGTIVSKTWTITNNSTGSVVLNAATILPATLPAGQYKVVLKVTDNSAAIATDEMLLVVNKIPIANAGVDFSITAPANSVTINSNNSSDPDGTIVTYSWSRISGPGSITFQNQNTATPTFSGMAVGQHIFKLVVTDNYGFTSSDTMKVDVLLQTAIVNTRNRILIDAGPLPSVGQTSVQDKWGKYWNNITDGRAGIRLSNALDTANRTTSLGIEILNRLDGTFGINGNGMNGGNTIGDVGDYPATATNDNVFAHNSTTSGAWKIFGLDPALTYSFKFWGTRSTYGVRTIQIKRSTDADYTQESNSVMNVDYNNAIYFNNITGVTEVVFNIRVKPGLTFGNISVIDIVTNSNASAAIPAANITQNNIASVAVLNTAIVGSNVATTTNEKVNLQIWPNPTSGKSNLQMGNSYRGQVLISVVNVNGATVKTYSVVKTQEMLTQTLEMTGLAKGMYYLKLIMGNKTEIQKLVLQ